MAGPGTAVNVATIVAGTAAGLVVGPRIAARARETMLQSVGIVTLALGLSQAVRSRNVVFPLVAVVVGGLAGEAARIEERLEQLGRWIRTRVDGDADPETEGAPASIREHPGSFVEGFVAASLRHHTGHR